MPTVTYTDFNTHPRTEGQVEVLQTRRSWGGYNVVRRDNRRLLGWVVEGREKGTWISYVAAEAFKGRSVADTGRLLDEVPEYLAGTIEHAKRIVIDNSRRAAVHDLVAYLVHREATAITGRQHPAVIEHRISARLAALLGETVRDTDY